MNLRAIISALTLLIISFQGYGQTIDTIFYDANWKETVKASSSYYRILVKKEDGKFFVTDYYNSGQVQMTGTLTAHDPDMKDGDFVYYYENGAIKTKSTFVNGQETATKSWDQNGKDVVLDGKVEVQPEYPGGIQNFYQYIASHFVYPKGFNPRPIGTIMLSFVIEKDGRSDDVRVVSSVHKIVDAEAVRVIRSMPKWKPGIQKGQPVRVMYNIPLSMK
jgi:protein TonB